MAKPFRGVINVDVTQSVPDWEPYTQPIAPEGTPNVLYIVLDDVGYSAAGPYGGLIETPNIDRIAQRGLTYTNFHTTALCSPTRSCLMTGRNHTTNGMATITEAASGFPSSNGHIPFECATIAEVLGERGWNTDMVGKWHRGWGSSRTRPNCRRSTLTPTPPAWTGSTWPELDTVRPWDSSDRRREAAVLPYGRSVRGASRSDADHDDRALLDHLEQSGQLDNTIIVLVSDNGASGEGGPNGSVNENKMFNGIPYMNIEAKPAATSRSWAARRPITTTRTGLAMAFNTPFKLWKWYSNWRGGTADPMIASWPARITSSRPAPPVRARHRHRAHAVLGAGDRAA